MMQRRSPIPVQVGPRPVVGRLPDKAARVVAGLPHKPIKDPSKSKHGRLGPYSRAIDRGALGSVIPPHSREGRYLRHYEAMLTQHVGGKPSIVERQVIVRASRLALHLELLDERTLSEGKGLGQTDLHFYVSWSNALVRHLEKLGLKSSAAAIKAPTLAELFPGRAA